MFTCNADNSIRLLDPDESEEGVIHDRIVLLVTSEWGSGKDCGERRRSRDGTAWRADSGDGDEIDRLVYELHGLTEER